MRRLWGVRRSWPPEVATPRGDALDRGRMAEQEASDTAGRSAPRVRKSPPRPAAVAKLADGGGMPGTSNAVADPPVNSPKTTSRRDPSPAEAAQAEAPAAAAPAPARKGDRLRAAVIGTGKISDEHLRFLAASPLASLVGVCDLSPSMARYAAMRYGCPDAYTAAAQMLAEQRPDVVHVLTPPQSHAKLATECLDAGAHVIVEKPIALNH